MDLAHGRCIACRKGEPVLSDPEIASLLALLSGWTLQEQDGVKQLRKSYRFKDFTTALAFTDRIGQLAESEGHHPAILTEWGSVTVSWWTHIIRGLHRNDFIMAAKTDRLAED